MRGTKWVAASLIWGLVAPVALARAFIDVPDDHWAAAAVRFAAVDHGFMQPHPDGSFRGEDPFTRAQLALALRRLLQTLEAQSHVSWESPERGGYPFEDLPRDPAQAQAALDVANRYHLFEGMPGVFARALGSDRRVTRYEMALALDHLLHLGEARGAIDPGVLEPRHVVYSDMSDGVYAADAVHELSDRYQVTVGFPDHTFRGPEELTRFQFAAAVAQAFPLVRDLVELTHERHERRRFQEDMPVALGLGLRLDGRGGPFLPVRLVGYWGPVFGLAEARVGVPVGAADKLSDGTLAAGLAWTPGLALAFQPYIGARMGYSGGTRMVAGRFGAIASWNPDPMQLWLNLGGTKPLGASLGDPGGPLMPDVTLGAGWMLSSHLALTLELGYTQLPVAPPTAGYTFGTENALLATTGLSFGF